MSCTFTFDTVSQSTKRGISRNWKPTRHKLQIAREWRASLMIYFPIDGVISSFITLTSSWATMASQITSLTIVYSTVCSDADQRKHQSSASLASVRGIHQWSVNSPHRGPVTRKMFPFDDVIMATIVLWSTHRPVKMARNFANDSLNAF